MRKEKAFTLIELLVVIAIIALLVSILVPSLTRAKDMAKKAVCSTTISNHGKSMAMYMSLYDSFPMLSPWPWMSPSFALESEGSPTNHTLGWPTFYGILEMTDMNGSDRTTWGTWYYGAPIDQIWDGCVCPAMNAPSIWAAQDNAASLPDFGQYGTPLWWMSFHKWAVGYQFSEYLRSAVPLGRYPTTPGPLAQDPNVDFNCYQWIMGNVGLLNGQHYYIQAINNEELAQASSVAQAWDGWDLESTPGIPWLTESQRRGDITPGWHSGPVTFGARAIFNGYRHNSCPNILYADGHVAADANDLADPIDDLNLSAEYAGMHAYTYSQYSIKLFGNLGRVIPVAELLE